VNIPIFIHLSQTVDMAFRIIIILKFWLNRESALYNIGKEATYFSPRNLTFNSPFIMIIITIIKLPLPGSMIKKSELNMEKLNVGPISL
jgi:hypothetical protein